VTPADSRVDVAAAVSVVAAMAPFCTDLAAAQLRA